MPTYRNRNQTAVKYAHVNFYPETDTAVSFFVPHEELNFSLISDLPTVHSPVLFSGTVTGETLSIPHAANVILSAVTPSAATLYFADDTEGVSITSATGFHMTGRWRDIGRVRVEGTAQITVERG